MDKILTMTELVRFCQKNNMYAFSSKESGKQIIVHSHQDFANVSFEEDETKLYAKVRVCHTLLNRNGSYISEENMLKAMPTLKYAPFLAAIHQLDDGTYDFHGHDMHIETDEDGNETLVYDEKQVGTFTSDEPYLEYDEKMDKTYVCAKVAIPKEYTRTVDILKEKGGTKVSCELVIDTLQYNAKERYLELIDFKFMGCAALGREKDGTEIGEGMIGSKVCFEDFTDNALTNYQSQMIEFQARLEKLESACFNKDNQRKEEHRVDMNENFDEVTEIEEVTETEETTEEEVTVTENESEDTVEVTSEDDEAVEETNKVEETAEETAIFEKMVRTYEISHEDVRYALYNLLEAFESTDNEFYFINSVYDTYFTYENWLGDKIFGQAYVKDGDNVSFDGERYSLHRELLTDSEYTELQNMRSNYSALVEFKETVEKNELHSQKEEILANEKYSSLAENEAFKELVKNMDNYSLADLEKEAKVIFADNITIETFANKAEKKPATVKMFANAAKAKKDSRYGNLFSK